MHLLTRTFFLSCKTIRQNDFSTKMGIATENTHYLSSGVVFELPCGHRREKSAVIGLPRDQSLRNPHGAGGKPRYEDRSRNLFADASPLSCSLGWLANNLHNTVYLSDGASLLHHRHRSLFRSSSSDAAGLRHARALRRGKRACATQCCQFSASGSNSSVFLVTYSDKLREFQYFFCKIERLHRGSLKSNKYESY